MMQSTSRLAYREVKNTLSARQQAVWNALDEPMTNLELSEKLGWAINTVTPRVNEMAKAERVRLYERRKCRVSGRTAIAWIRCLPDRLF